MIENLPLDPVFLPSVSLENLKSLPSISAVYFALSDDAQILYIGATQNLRKRWNGHSKLDALRAMGFASIAYYDCPHEHLAACEYTMICQFRPPLNAPSSYRYSKPPFSKEAITFALGRTAINLLESLAFSMGIKPNEVLELIIREKAKREHIHLP